MVLGETSKFTTESHKLLQGDVGELFLGLYRQPRQFCETFAEVTNYVIAFCETMWKSGAIEIEF